MYISHISSHTPHDYPFFSPPQPTSLSHLAPSRLALAPTATIPHSPHVTPYIAHPFSPSNVTSESTSPFPPPT